MIVKHKNILYELKDGRYSKTATIIKCLSNKQKITIPKEIEYPFPTSKNQKEQESSKKQENQEDKRSVKYIINDISSCAFKDCENLKSISFDSLKNIEYIGENAFNNCISLRNIKIPPNITHISSGCFLNCIHLKKVETEANIESIGQSAFEGCKSLKSINNVKTDNLQYIYEDAFKDCCNLSIDAKIDSLKEIRKNAFDNCKQVSIIGDSLEYKNGAIYESINSSINTKWDISHKILLPFGIVVVFWLIYGVLGALIPSFDSSKYSAICSFHLIALTALSFTPICLSYALHFKSKKWLAVFFYVLSIVAFFALGISFLSNSKNAVNYLQSISISKNQQDNHYELSYIPIAQDENLIKKEIESNFNVEKNGSPDKQYQLQHFCIEKGRRTLIEIDNYLNSNIIDEIKLVFTENKNSVIITANADNIPFSVDYNDKSHTNYIKDKEFTYIFDIENISVFDITINKDGNKQTSDKPLFRFQLDNSIASNDIIPTSQYVLFFLVIFNVIIGTILLFIHFSPKILKFVDTYKGIMILGLIIAYIIFSLINKRTIVETLQGIINAVS